VDASSSNAWIACKSVRVWNTGELLIITNDVWSITTSSSLFTTSLFSRLAIAALLSSTQESIAFTCASSAGSARSGSKIAAIAPSTYVSSAYPVRSGSEIAATAPSTYVYSAYPVRFGSEIAAIAPSTYVSSAYPVRSGSKIAAIASKLVWSVSTVTPTNPSHKPRSPNTFL